MDHITTGPSPHARYRPRPWLIALLLLLAVAFGIFVWPTCYAYRNISGGVLCTNRLTGNQWVMYRFDWVPVQMTKTQSK